MWHTISSPPVDALKASARISARLSPARAMRNPRTLGRWSPPLSDAISFQPPPHLAPRCTHSRLGGQNPPQPSPLAAPADACRKLCEKREMMSLKGSSEEPRSSGSRQHAGHFQSNRNPIEIGRVREPLIGQEKKYRNQIRLNKRRTPGQGYPHAKGAVAWCFLWSNCTARRERPSGRCAATT